MNQLYRSRMVPANIDPVPSERKTLGKKGKKGVFSFMIHISLLYQFQSIAHLLDPDA